MHVKKMLGGAATVALISLLFVMPVSAHGHHSRTTLNTDCPVCTVEGCTEVGRHTHEGHDYCGYDHRDGYCDGSCEQVSRCGYGRRHGCHH